MSLAACSVLLCGCAGARTSREQRLGPAYDRPFPLGQVSDSFWETQQTNAEAADFIFYDHEFVGETAELTDYGRKHLLQVALRMKHVPFPITVEQSVRELGPELDRQRRQTITGELARLGVEGADQRVAVAPALAEGITAVEGEAAYYATAVAQDFGNGGGVGRRFGGRGGTFR
ncbi:MAG: hypothetical protein JXB62_21730 [Pirellulales bacterium]|nr:hypothetical protein [Pirellulales bacterium]